jgi:hypothetical protein
MPANQFNVLMNNFNKLRSTATGRSRLRTMTKFRLQIWVILFLLVNYLLKRKMTILSLSALLITIQHLWYPAWIENYLQQPRECVDYCQQDPATLQAKGLFTASLDSIIYDSAFARVVL